MHRDSLTPRARTYMHVCRRWGLLVPEAESALLTRARAIALSRGSPRIGQNHLEEALDDLNGPAGAELSLEQDTPEPTCDEVAPAADLVTICDYCRLRGPACPFGRRIAGLGEQGCHLAVLTCLYAQVARRRAPGESRGRDL